MFERASKSAQPVNVAVSLRETIAESLKSVSYCSAFLSRSDRATVLKRDLV